MVHILLIFSFLRLLIDFGLSPWFRPNQAAFATTLSGSNPSSSPKNTGSILILYNNSYRCLERFYNFSGIIVTRSTESGGAHYRVNVC